jgi:hypothetical protein
VETLSDCVATWGGIPRQYVFLVGGWLAGLVIGFLVGRSRGEPKAEAAPPAAAPEADKVNLVVNGQVLDIPQAVLNEIHSLLRDENQGAAIKALREATGLGAPEAKVVIGSLKSLVR